VESLSKVNIWLKLMRFGEKMGCHQMADRSFFFKGYQFPVCARCTGVILGELIAIICLFFVKLEWWICLLFLVPMAVDWGLQFLRIVQSTNIRRLITGTLGGFGLTYVYYLIGVSVFNFLCRVFAL
jgi:uncharacterized membrane protein